MASIAQLAAQRVVVVDLAVLDRPDRLVLVRKRLMAALDVDDAQPARAERCAVSRVRTAVVRSPVPDDLEHRLQPLGRQRLVVEIRVDDERSANPAHAEERSSTGATAPQAEGQRALAIGVVAAARPADEYSA